ncbi:hypothetical protein V3C99_016070 [Haemonchus contortus]
MSSEPMSCDEKVEDIDESILDEPVEGANAVDDEEIDDSILDHEMEAGNASEAQSDAHSYTQSDNSPPRSAEEVKEENSNDTQHTDTEEKPKRNGDSASKKTPTKRSRRSRTRRNESDDENEDEDKDEDMEIDHKAMLSSADRKIQVGDDFQARVDEPQKTEEELEMSEEDEREHVMWRPPGDLDEAKLMEFCEDAIGVYKLSYDRALYLLQKSNFDFDVARKKVKTRRLITEEWSEDDRTLFKQAFHMFGKRFDKIRQTMPHRSMASIIQFYYNTKKDTDYKSLFDSRMADDSDDADGSDDELDYEDGLCDNCGEECNTLHTIDDVKLCYVCRVYYKLMRKHRPCNYASTVSEVRQRRVRKCPEDMLEIAKEFVEMSTYVEERPTSDENVCDEIEVVQPVKTKCYEETKAAMRELTRVRSRAIRLECNLKAQRADGLMNGLDNYRYLTAKEDRKDEEGSSRRDRVRGSHTWTEEERMIAFHCLLRYGKDFDAVAEVLGTKTSDKVKSFYSEMKPDIDRLLEKEAEKDAEMIKGFNLDQEFCLDAPKNVEVVNLD